MSTSPAVFCKKIAHVTREDALAHLKALVWKHESRGESQRSRGLAVYPCDRCEAWHVGHQPSIALVWHYSIGTMLDRILDAGELRPRRPQKVTARHLRHMSPKQRSRARRMWNEQAPLLWFSRNKDWEHSVIKIAPSRPFPPYPPAGRCWNEMSGEGLIRFGVPASLATLRWGDFLDRNPMPIALRDAMTRRGNPTEWLATSEAVPLERCRAIEMYYRGAWTPIADIDPDDADRYFEQRYAAYEEGWNSLLEKLGGLERVASGELFTPQAALNEVEAILYADIKQEYRQRGSAWVRAHDLDNEVNVGREESKRRLNEC
jgi:hypothetical protein